MLSEQQREFIKNPDEYRKENSKAAVRNMRKRIREKVLQASDDLLLLQRNREVWKKGGPISDPDLQIDPEQSEEKSQVQIFREIHDEVTQQIVEEVISQSYKALFNTDTPIGRRLNLKSYAIMRQSSKLSVPPADSETKSSDAVRSKSDSIQSKYSISNRSEELGPVQKVVTGLLSQVNQSIDWEFIRDTYDPHPENIAIKITLVTQSCEPIEGFSLVINEEPEIVTMNEIDSELELHGELVGYQQAILNIFDPDSEYRPHDAYYQNGTLIMISPEERSETRDWMFWSNVVDEFGNISE